MTRTSDMKERKMTKEEAIERYNRLADVYKEMMNNDCYDWYEMKPVYDEMTRLFNFINKEEVKV